MLIEAKVRVKRNIDGKPRKRTETYIMEKDFFTQAEYAVSALLSNDAEEFEIQSLKLSPIKEITEQQTGEHTFIATLRDIFHDDEGNEKFLRYKVLLWADNLTQANQRAQDLSHQGYDMLIEGIKQVDYEYLTEEDNEQADE